MNFRIGKCREGEAMFALSALVMVMGGAPLATAGSIELTDAESLQHISLGQLQTAEDRLVVSTYLKKQGVTASLEMVDELMAKDPGLSFLNQEEGRMSFAENILGGGGDTAKFEVVGRQNINPNGGSASIYAHADSSPTGTGAEGLLSYASSAGFLGFSSSGGEFRNLDGLVSASAADAGAVLVIPFSYGLRGSTSAPVDNGSIGTHYGVYGKAEVNLASGQDPSSLFQYGVYGTTNQATGYGGYFTNTVAIGTNYSQALYVKGGGTNDSAGRSDPRAYAATIEATESSNAKMLAIYLSSDEASDADYYIGFLAQNRAGTADRVAGKIRGVAGTSENGIQLISNAADFAEFLPRSNPDEKMEAGDVVGVVNGRISRDLSKAHNIQVVSSAPIVVGNMPEPEQEHLYESVAFVGQVPVKVIGKVVTGDYIVASGKNDGTAVAISPANMTPEQFRLAVGQAWESSDEAGVKLVNTAVGLVANDAYAYMKKQDQRIASLEQQLSEKMARLDRLAAQMESLTQKVAYIQSANMTAKVE